MGNLQASLLTPCRTLNNYFCLSSRTSLLPHSYKLLPFLFAALLQKSPSFLITFLQLFLLFLLSSHKKFFLSYFILQTIPSFFPCTFNPIPSFPTSLLQPIPSFLMDTCQLLYSFLVASFLQSLPFLSHF